MPDMLIARSTHALVAYGKVPYVFGGTGPLSKCEKMVCGHWETLPDMLCAKSYVSGALSGQRIFIAGNGSAYLEEFNPSTNRFR